MPQGRMTDEEFDAALIGAGFAAIARHGWPRVSIASAAREAGLDLARDSVDRHPERWGL
jgi:hypothetical protein